MNALLHACGARRRPSINQVGGQGGLDLRHAFGRIVHKDVHQIAVGLHLQHAGQAGSDGFGAAQQTDACWYRGSAGIGRSSTKSPCTSRLIRSGVSQTTSRP